MGELNEQSILNLEQWFSNLSLHQNHLEDCCTSDYWGPCPTVEEEELRICISNKFTRDARAPD